MNESAPETPNVLIKRLKQLLYEIERHRLKFLCAATASRYNPMMLHRPTGGHELLRASHIAGWSELVEAIEPTGAWLWTYRDVLDQFAQYAFRRFGMGEGDRPGYACSDGTFVTVKDGTFPCWVFDDQSVLFLQETTDAIMKECQALAEVARVEPVSEVLRDACAIARPDGRDRWCSTVSVSWSYLSRLDSLIARINILCVNLAMPPSVDAARPRVTRQELAPPVPETRPSETTLLLQSTPEQRVNIGVVLGRPGESCTVNGKAKKALTDGQHDVVAALIAAGEHGLSKDALESVRSSARRMLVDLRRDSDWANVIIMPGQTNGRYRVRT